MKEEAKNVWEKVHLSARKLDDQFYLSIIS